MNRARLVRWAKEGGLALLAAGLLCGLVEFALAWSGALDRPVGALGYDANAAYLVPCPTGGWQTQFQQEGWDEVVVPPKGDEVRVVILGASTAHSFWAGRLHERLNERYGSKRYTEFNLGRGGYGSERVRFIAEQALERLAPDLIVVYTGDNEFVEIPPPRREFDWSQRLRRLRMVRAVLGPRAGDAVVPEPWIPFIGGATLRVPFETTLARTEGLRENLRAIAAAADARGVPMVLSTVVYNRLAAPFVSNFPPELGAAEREHFETLTSEASALMPEFLNPLRVLKPEDRLRIQDWTAIEQRDPAARERWKLPGRRASAGPFARAKPYGTEVWQWNERIWTLFEALERFHARDVDAVERERLERAAALLQQALEIHPGHAQTNFELGLVGYLLGESRQDVRGDFERASAFDHLPQKGNERINAIVRDVAAEFPNTMLFDADRIFSERMPGRLWGWEWMLDHCHMVQGARQVFMQDLADALLARWPQGFGD